MVIEIIAGKVTEEELFDLRWLYSPFISLCPKALLTVDESYMIFKL